MKSSGNIINCPIEIALKHLGRKWTMRIIRDLFRGKNRFRDFLNANPKISTKMLSQRLKELQKSGLIEKNVISDTPIIVEYSLTKKGRSLNRVLFHLAAFALKNHPKEVYTKNAESQFLEIDIAFFKKVFEIDEDDLKNNF